MVSSSIPEAVVVESFNPSAYMDMNYNAVTSGGPAFHTPYLMKNYYGWNSCVVVQNTTSTSTNVYLVEY